MPFSKKLPQYILAGIPANLHTPSYVYSEEILEELYKSFEEELKKHSFPAPLRWHYAMKANALPRLLKYFKSKGAGIDLVSKGELAEALQLGFKAEDLVFSGVGKKNEELELALENNLFLINVESESELKRLSALAQKKQKKARFSLRVNPDVDAKTHPYISTGMWEHKFGLPFDEAERLYKDSLKSAHLDPVGMSVHIGSQIFDVSVLKEAIDKTLELAKVLISAGVPLKVLDVGGGLGVDYTHPDEFPNFKEYASFLSHSSKAWKKVAGDSSRVVFECGRAFTAQAGFLLTEVVALKKSLKKNFLIVDASMTEILRPALYKAEHPFFFLKSKAALGEEKLKWEVVGPVCESSDVLAKNVFFEKVGEGDLLAMGCAGAYGSVMSQFYNSRPLPPEFWIGKNGTWELCRSALMREYPVDESS